MASGNVKNFELKLGKTALIIVIVGVAALLCSTFLFGVSVGKNIDNYPEKIASLPQKLLALVWKPAKIKIAQNAPASKAMQNQQTKSEDVDLTFYSTLTSKKGVVKEQPIPDKKPAAETPAAQPLLPPAGAESNPAPVSPGTEVKKQQTPVAGSSRDEIEEKIKEAEAAAALAAAAGGKYSIQVASLKDKNKAGEMGKKLSAMGYAPRVVENNVPGKGKWFRVVIDGFPGKAQALAAAEKISGKTGASCIVRKTDAAVGSN